MPLPAYQVQRCASGHWQLRLYDLPVEGPPPALPNLPVLTELAACKLDEAIFRTGADGRFTVLRLSGEGPVLLAFIQAKLLAHNIRRGGDRPAAAGRR